MADLKISALTASTTPLAGTEVLPIVQSSTTKQVSVANLTAGRTVSAASTLVGTTTAQTSWTSGTALQSQVANAVASGSYSGFSAYQYTTSATNSSGGMLVLGRSGSSTLGTLAPTGLNNTLGFISFEGVNSSNALVSGAYLSVTQTGASGASYLPAQWSFYTSTGSAAPTESFRIDSSQNVTVSTGNLIIGTSGQGIDFSATSGSGTSELLADYEEGTFTPTVAGVTLTIAAGRYTKIGRTVFVEIFCRFPATADITSTEIAGLPFTPVTGGNTYIGGVNVQASISTHVRNVVLSTGIIPRTSSDTAFTNVSFSSADVSIAGTYTA